MNVGRYIFRQVVDYVPRYQIDKLVAKYRGDWHVKDLTCLVGLDVVLVAVVVLATLLCPASIDVLVAALVSLAILLLLGVALFCLPKAAAVAILDLLVLIMGVALAGASTKVASMILPSLNDKPRESRYDLNLSNRRSNVPVLPSLSRHAHTVFSSGTSATV